jgi:nucleotide-binding universal stress UspA family protein
MKRIMIATDGSPSAVEALEAGLEFAAEQDAPVTLVHVITKNELHPRPAFEHPEKDEVLREAAASARELGIDAELELRSGDPADEISWLAESREVGLLVIGSRGRGTVQGALLGSVSKAVLAACNRPVMVVRHTHAKAPA